MEYAQPPRSVATVLLWTHPGVYVYRQENPNRRGTFLTLQNMPVYWYHAYRHTGKYIHTWYLVTGTPGMKHHHSPCVCILRVTSRRACLLAYRPKNRQPGNKWYLVRR